MTAVEQAPDHGTSPWRSVWTGVLVGATNPKTIVFYLAILPTVIPLDQMTPLAFAELTVIVVVVLLIIGLGYAWLAASAREMFKSTKALRILNRTAGVMKLKIRDLIYRQVLALGPGPFDQRRTGGAT